MTIVAKPYQGEVYRYECGHERTYLDLCPRCQTKVSAAIYTICLLIGFGIAVLFMWLF